MDIFDRLKRLDNVFAWGFTGFVLGVLGLAYAIYVEQFKVEKPKLVFDVLSNTSVLSISENLNKLDIVYDGQNIEKANENLILLTVRIANEGSEAIKEGDFYSGLPFGFKIQGGRIVEFPALIEASDSFIREQVSILHDSLNQIKITKVPLDVGSYFTIKILTICKNGVIPTVVPVGKVSGLREFVVIESFKGARSEERTFFEVVISGSFGVHATRFLGYIVLFIGFYISLAYAIGKVVTFFSNKSRNKIIQKFIDDRNDGVSRKMDFVFNLYKEIGPIYLKWMNSEIQKEQVFLDMMQRTVEDNASKYGTKMYRINMNKLFGDKKDPQMITQGIMWRLSHNKVIASGVVDPQFKDELGAFVKFLESTGNL